MQTDASTSADSAAEALARTRFGSDRAAPAENPAAPIAPVAATGSRARRRGQSINVEHAPGTTADVLAVVRPLITAARWASVVIGMAMTTTSPAHRTPAALVWGAVLTAYALLRTFRPLRYHPRRVQELGFVVAEVALTAAAVIGTGYWSSPFFFSLATAVVIAGFARSFFFAIDVSMVVAVVVGVLFGLRTAVPDHRLTTLGASELLLVAFVAGYARRIFGEAEARTTLALDRVSRLTEANGLLQELHRVTQGLPATLDLPETLASTTLKLREMLSPVVVAILLYDEGTRTWTPGSVEGTRVGATIPSTEMPGPLVAAVAGTTAVLVPELSPGAGLGPTSRSGVYVALRARDKLVGAIAIERRDANSYTPRDATLLNGLAEQVALAVDNGRWFSRLRTVGADEERTRIARDLHDRVGQSLAYLGFELDRICRSTTEEATQQAVAALRQDVRRVVGEVRDTLYDLRTDVSETQDLGTTIESFLDRVRQRSDVRIVLRVNAPHRLPLPQEREMWRIAQEAVTNAERHGSPAAITVTWQCDRNGAVLEITDDGSGFEAGAAGRLDSYGMLGMRERADAIGALLEVRSAPGRGTVVRCTLGGERRGALR